MATPIFGGATPPEEVAKILAGVEQKKGIVILQESMDTLVRRGQTHPEEMEQCTFREAETRRKAYTDQGYHY